MMDLVLDGLRRMTMLFTGTEVMRLGEIEASVTPSSPERSLLNAVIYEPGASLEAVYPRLVEIYDRAGIRAWTVWVPEADHGVAEMLAGHGHVLDAAPRAMAVQLDALDLTEPDPGAKSSPPSLDEIAEINEIAYGYPPGDLASVMKGDPPHGWHAYASRGGDGRVISVVIADDHGDNCDITFVATRPEHRGEGLAGSLILTALGEAQGRELKTTTLVATKAGYPLYARLGYQDLGGIEMWELRS